MAGLGTPALQNLTNVTIAGGTLAATQSGIWTVQPGNTANTVPWLVKPHDGTNPLFKNAAALADTTPNPTIGGIQNFPMVFNGTTWDRNINIAQAYGTFGIGIPASGISVENPVDFKYYNLFGYSPNRDAIVANEGFAAHTNAFRLVYNGTTWDRVLSAVHGTDTTGTGISTTALLAEFDDSSPTSIIENQFGNIRMSANRNLYGTIRDAAGNERGANVDANNNLGVVLASETTKVLGVTRTADGTGNLVTTNSTTYSSKFGWDTNLLGTLGTAFSTPGKVDVKGADGDVFVRQTTGSNLHTVSDYGVGDTTPAYSNRSLGGIQATTDAAGLIQTASEIITDQGTSRAWFTGSSISYSPGSATFTNNSTTVTAVSGFTATDLHFLDFVKISAHGESAWAQVSYVNSDTQLTLINPYTGATTTGAYDISRVATITGSGATISVASGQLTLATGGTNGAATVVYKTAAFPPFQNGSVDSAFSISQRIANQDIYFGLENATSSARFFARFHFTGTTNTQVITETAYNPTGVPTSSEVESNTVTLPNGVNTSAVNTYKIDAQYDKVVFSINGFVVATHTQRLMPIWLQAVNCQIRTINNASVTTTSIVANYMFQRAYSRIETSTPISITPNNVNPQTSLPVAANVGTPMYSTGDKFGRQVVLPVTIRDLVGTQTTTISSSTAETTIVTQAASVFNDLLLLVISNTSATATRIDFRDTTSGTILFSLEAPATDTRGFSLGGVPIPQTGVNTNWTAQCATSVADIRIYAVFAKNK